MGSGSHFGRGKRCDSGTGSAPGSRGARARGAGTTADRPAGPADALSEIAGGARTPQSPCVPHGRGPGQTFHDVVSGFHDTHEPMVLNPLTVVALAGQRVAPSHEIDLGEHAHEVPERTSQEDRHPGRGRRQGRSVELAPRSPPARGADHHARLRRGSGPVRVVAGTSVSVGVLWGLRGCRGAGRRDRIRRLAQCWCLPAGGVVRARSSFPRLLRSPGNTALSTNGV